MPAELFGYLGEMRTVGAPPPADFTIVVQYPQIADAQMYEDIDSGQRIRGEVLRGMLDSAQRREPFITGKQRAVQEILVRYRAVPQLPPNIPPPSLPGGVRPPDYGMASPRPNNCPPCPGFLSGGTPLPPAVPAKVTGELVDGLNAMEENARYEYIAGALQQYLEGVAQGAILWNLVRDLKLSEQKVFSMISDLRQFPPASTIGTPVFSDKLVSAEFISPDGSMNPAQMASGFASKLPADLRSRFSVDGISVPASRIAELFRVADEINATSNFFVALKVNPEVTAKIEIPANCPPCPPAGVLPPRTSPVAPLPGPAPAPVPVPAPIQSCPPMRADCRDGTQRTHMDAKWPECDPCWQAGGAKSVTPLPINILPMPGPVVGPPTLLPSPAPQPLCPDIARTSSGELAELVRRDGKLREGEFAIGNCVYRPMPSIVRPTPGGGGSPIFSPPIQAPIAPAPAPRPPSPVTPRPGLCYDGFTLGPESLLYGEGKIPLCKEPPSKPPSVCPVIPPQPPITRYCPPCPRGQNCPDIACIGDIPLVGERAGIDYRMGSPTPAPDPCDPPPDPCLAPKLPPQWADNPYALHAPAIALPPGITPGCPPPPPPIPTPRPEYPIIRPPIIRPSPTPIFPPIIPTPIAPAPIAPAPIVPPPVRPLPYPPVSGSGAGAGTPPAGSG